MRLRPAFEKFWPLVLFLIIVIFFFHPFIFSLKLPIPSDTIVGMYHPFRDVTWDKLTSGVPFKNFLITDSVRQEYPWRKLAVEIIKKGELPLWNPYSFAGMPLLANLQSAPFYPLNFLLLFLPFNLGWGFMIFLQPILAGCFLYFYLRNFQLDKSSSLLGAFVFSFSGFFIAWLEWGTILHSALWLPLILLSIDKIFANFTALKNSKSQLKNKNLIRWSIIFIFSLISSFFAGHLQTFFYVGVFSVIYLAARWWQYGRNAKIIPLFIIYSSLFIILTLPQWLPMLKLINLSGRDLDQVNWHQDGWFIPWQNLIQFFAPDFFGNPTTLNYWGTWNYGEFIGYIGILPLLLSLYALFFRQDKKTLFFGSLFFLSLIFALPTPFAKIPYQSQIPLLSTSQPTRLLFIANFSLAVLSALGINSLLKTKGIGRKMSIILCSAGLVFAGLWVFVIAAPKFSDTALVANLSISKRNLFLPTFLFFLATLLFVGFASKKISKRFILMGIFLLVIFDLLRFAQKFTPFTKEEWLFPKTKTIEFLITQAKPYRFMSTDREIFPPNFSSVYHLESVEGYDPLYLARYAELTAASERKEPNISPPFGFNRIITPQNFESQIMDLMNVKYVLSLKDLNSKKLRKVFQEGQTRVYENLNVLPRSFFVERITLAKSKQEAINLMFGEGFIPEKVAVVEMDGDNLPPSSFKSCSPCSAKITYHENMVTIITENQNDGFLVLTDSFYPSWKVEIDGKRAKIYRTDYNFRGVFLPKGKHGVVFTDQL